jgi:hypothetical protein
MAMMNDSRHFWAKCKSTVIAAAAVCCLLGAANARTQGTEEIAPWSGSPDSNLEAPDYQPQIDRIEQKTDSLAASLQEAQETWKRKFRTHAAQQRGVADTLRREIDTLQSKTTSLQSDQEILTSSLNRLTDTTDQIFGSLRRQLRTHRILILAVLLISLTTLLAIALVRRKKAENRLLAEENLKLYDKVCEMLDTQLRFMERMEKRSGPEEQKTDHTLAIRVGIEIFRMRKGLENVDTEVKGINALKFALNLLEEEFIRQGYIIKDLTGQPYLPEYAFKIKKSIAEEKIKSGKPVIEKMITPQILYRGEIVYHGEVELGISSQDS